MVPRFDRRTCSRMLKEGTNSPWARGPATLAGRHRCMRTKVFQLFQPWGNPLQNPATGCNRFWVQPCTVRWSEKYALGSSAPPSRSLFYNPTPPRGILKDPCWIMHPCHDDTGGLRPWARNYMNQKKRRASTKYLKDLVGIFVSEQSELGPWAPWAC